MKFTTSWFHQAHEGVWPHWLAPLLLPRSPVRLLEIGCYEGAASTWLLRRIVSAHPDSRLVCVDPWDASEEHAAAYARFIDNINETELSERVSVIRGSSRSALPPMRDQSFDLVYVDGDHTEDGAAFDTEQALRLVKRDGIVIWDDVYFVGPKTPDVVRGVERGLRACGVRGRPVVQIGVAAVLFRGALP